MQIVQWGHSPAESGFIWIRIDEQAMYLQCMELTEACYILLLILQYSLHSTSATILSFSYGDQGGRKDQRSMIMTLSPIWFGAAQSQDSWEGVTLQ